MTKVIIVTWRAMDGSEPTGWTVLRDGYHRPEYRPAMIARAVVWSYDMARLPQAREWAKEEGHTVRVMDDAPGVLAEAKRLELEEPRSTPPGPTF